MNRRGALVVVEGIDRSGKSTQCQKLVEALHHNGHKVKSMKFPDRTTETGMMIDKYLQRGTELDDHVVHLLFSANRWEQQQKMRSDLSNGITLIVDRYAYSGVAFTSSKKHFNLDWCKQPDCGLPKPDVVLFLDLSVDAAACRGGFGDERYEETEFQKMVRENFMKLKEKNWKVIDASQSLLEVHEQMLTHIKEIIENCNNNPIKQLWVDS